MSFPVRSRFHPAQATRSAFGLIEIMVVIVIILILALILIPRLTKPTKDPETGKIILPPKQRAQQVAGNAYITQINQAITMYKMDNDNQNPPTLQELKRYGVTDAMLTDPVTKQLLAYDPQTGQVGAGSVSADFAGGRGGNNGIDNSMTGGGSGVGNPANGGGTSSLPNVGALPPNIGGGTGQGANL